MKGGSRCGSKLFSVALHHHWQRAEVGEDGGRHRTAGELFASPRVELMPLRHLVEVRGAVPMSSGSRGLWRPEEGLRDQVTCQGRLPVGESL